MQRDCVHKSDYAKLRSGELPGPEAVRISAHVRSCPRCGSSYVRLLSDEDLLGCLRSAALELGVDRPSSVPNYRPVPVPSPTMPAELEGYDIHGELQRGGQGVVYEGVERKTGQRVAIKVLLEDPLEQSARRRRRFETEIELASALSHPNIVQIIDSGLVVGHFYYVMEFVDGLRLDDYVRTREPGVPKTVELLKVICDTVQFAHQHGVIHRDLKPSNIRVDEAGRPRLLDFGLAKRLPSVVTSEAAVTTTANRFLGTLAYAAPEQTSTESPPVSTRTDVYALGVILYELLTGEFPYPVIGPLAEVMKHIGSTPPKPPVGIDGRIDGDLKAIIFKALSKDPQQRYATAGHLADELERYLRAEPLDVRSGSGLYVARKIARRHWFGVSTVVAGLCIVIGASTWQLWSLAQQRAANQITVLLQDMLDSVDVDQLAELDAAVLPDMLDKAVKRIDEQFSDEPIVHARLQTSVGVAYRRLGRYEKAEAQLRSALDTRLDHLGDDHLDSARSKNELAMLFMDQGRFDEAEALQREALAQFHDSPGALAHEATNLNDLATLLYVRGNYDEAEQLYREALSVARSVWQQPHAEIATMLNNLAELLRAKGDYEQAESLYREALIMYRGVQAADDPWVASVLNNLATLLRTTGEHAEAEALYRRSLGLYEDAYGGEHLKVAQVTDNLALLLRQQGDLQEAEKLCRESLRIRRAILGDEHLEVAAGSNNLAMLLRDQGELEEAETQLRRSLSVHEELLGPQHAKTVTVLNNLAGVIYLQGDRQQAKPLFERVLDLRKKVLGKQHKDTAASLNNLAAMHRDQGEFQEAEKAYREALDVHRQIFGDRHPAVAADLNNLALVLKHQHVLEESEELYNEALGIYREVYGGDHLLAAQTAYNLAILLKDSQQYEDAVSLLTEALSVRQKLLPPEHSEVTATRESLAVCLIKLADFAAAEPLLLENYDSFLDLHGPEDKRTVDALRWLVTLYTSWNKPDKVNEYERLIP